MNANDLQPELRELILTRIREQLGEASFRSLQMRLSDDQIIELAMQQSAEASAQDQKATKKTNWFGNIFYVIAMIIACCGPGYIIMMIIMWLGDWVFELASVSPEHAKSEKPSENTGCLVVLFIIAILINVVVGFWWSTPAGK